MNVGMYHLNNRGKSRRQTGGRIGICADLNPKIPLLAFRQKGKIRNQSDSSHSFGMTNDAVISNEGRYLLRQESLSFPELLSRQIRYQSDLSRSFEMTIFPCMGRITPDRRRWALLSAFGAPSPSFLEGYER